MNLTLTLRVLPLLALLSPFYAAAQQPASAGAPREVNLNEFVVKGNGVKEVRKKAKVSDINLMFDKAVVGDPAPWDSSYMLTRFPAPTDKRFLLSSIAGRLENFDTSQLEVFITVLQMNEGDTLFRQVPIDLHSAGKRPKNRYTVSVRDSGIVLQPAPFYLGYGFHVKPVREAFTYHLYAAVGGEGGNLRIKNGAWRLATAKFYPQVFPFTVGYLEL